MPIDTDNFRADILNDLAVHADPDRAEGAKAYLKSDREFLGVSVPVVRKVARASIVKYCIDDRAGVLAAVAVCWDGPVFECRLAAVEILVARSQMLAVADLEMLELMLRDAETWALVDPLAAKVVGTIVRNDPDGSSPILDRWAANANSFWVRRAAMFALLEDLRAGGGDWERFTRYADEMMGEREFFIRKAIGWVLRDTSRKRPDMVWDWSISRIDKMSGVTRREAFRHLGGVPVTGSATVRGDSR